jgi:hypothetical protein
MMLRMKEQQLHLKLLRQEPEQLQGYVYVESLFAFLTFRGMINPLGISQSLFAVYKGF